MALGALRKNGTSLPSNLATSISFCCGQFRFHRRFRASRVKAPSELPPPSPAPTGMRLCSATIRPKSVTAHRADAQVQIYLCRGLEEHERGVYPQGNYLPAPGPLVLVSFIPQNYNRRAVKRTL